TKDQLLKDGFVVNTILKEADLFCPNSVRINFTSYHGSIISIHYQGIFICAALLVVRLIRLKKRKWILYHVIYE
ncbi:hypothetical protein EFR51_09315, partial [Latilactobacillus curvatus]|uniref:hypothetical protein n=2 Tax=Latilactobacillus curvatus TaxID=28038 RepID=UPI0021A5CA44